MPSSRYREKNEPSTSSREKPHVIWVRSLVPKEKNCALPAISPAVSAARGTSIIVPIRVLTSTPVSPGDGLDDALGLGPDRLQLLHGADQRHHDLRPRVLASLLELGGGLGDRPDLHREQAGDDQAEPHAPQAQHRVGLVQPRARRRAVRAARPGSSPLALATATLTASSVRSGRNSCSGGSIRRTVTGSPSIAVKISTKSARWSGSSASSAACLVSWVLGQDQPLDQLAPVAEEHVLGTAQADALGAEAAGARGVRTGVGVGADQRGGAWRRRA